MYVKCKQGFQFTFQHGPGLFQVSNQWSNYGKPDALINMTLKNTGP